MVGQVVGYSVNRVYFKSSRAAVISFATMYTVLTELSLLPGFILNELRKDVSGGPPVTSPCSSTSSCSRSTTSSSLSPQEEVVSDNSQ